MKTRDSPEQAIVFVIDESLRDALGRLFRMVGLRAETFATAGDFQHGVFSDRVRIVSTRA